MKTASFLTLLVLSTSMTSPSFAAQSAITPAGDGGAICRDMIAAELAGRRMSPMLLAQAEQPAEQSQPQAKPDEAALANELSDLLQACSYDGQAFKVDPRALAAAGNGEEAVSAIMRFTGLPQNFKVMEGDVPNAAALIVMSSSGVPERVIAYNSKFMKEVRSATRDNDWASISILAHEIGHHLSGHTLMPGGSQPPIELEADKFSGYVLFKMGARLDDAQKAIATLVPEEDGPTHPGRPKRLAAVNSGWSESCAQQQADCAGADTVIAGAEPLKPAVPSAPEAPSKPVETTPQTIDGLTADVVKKLSAAEIDQLLIDRMGKLGAPGADVDAIGKDIALLNEAAAAKIGAPDAKPQLPDIPGPADIKMPGERGKFALAAVDRLPPLEASATPAKFDRFVYDEVGTFDTETKANLTKLAFDYAAANNIEIVTIVTNDLKGRTADQFALDAMRQLRVGKLEVGNGAVLVVAPQAKQTGVALGPGLLVEYEDTDALRGYLESYLKLLAGGTRPDAAGELIADASYRIMRDTKAWEWVIRFQSLDELQARAQKAREDLEKSGAKYDPNTDPTWRKLLRIQATVVTKSPDKADKVLDINAIKEKNLGPAMHVRTAEGKDAVLYVHRSVPSLMPVRLEEGKTYTFVAREAFAAADTPQFDLISYDLID